MSLVLTYSASLPVVKVENSWAIFKTKKCTDRNKEWSRASKLFSDNINGMEFSEKARAPDPKRLFKAYHNQLQL